MQRHRSYRSFLTPFKDVRITGNVKFLTFVQILIISVIYFAMAKAGLALSFQAQQVTVVWPPTGIALAAILLFGMRIWPGILLGAFLANITANETILTATAIAIGNSLEAITGAFLLKRFVNFDNNLCRVKDVIGLVFFSAIASTMISATIGVSSLCLGGIQPWNTFNSLWLQWWLGDASGALIVAPLLLAWGSKSTFLWQPARVAEAGILITGLIIASLIVFIGPINMGIVSNAFVYMLFPFIIWSSLRFNQRITTCLTLIASLIAVLATTHGFGQFHTDPMNQGLASLQIFMVIISTTGLLLGAAITERMEAENSLKESRERTKLVTDYALYAIITSDKYGRIIEWNKQAENIFGWSAQEAIGKNMLELIIHSKYLDMDQDLKGFFSNWKNILNNHFEVAAINKSGKTFPANLTITYQKILENNYFTAFVRSIAEQRIIEETKGLLAAMVESSSDAIISKNIDGTILSWNLGAQRIFGYTAEEAVGKSINIIIPENKLEEEKQILARLREGKSTENLETTRIAKDGHAIDISVTTSPIHDATGRVIGASKIARDITERKKTEAKLATAIEDLIVAKNIASRLQKDAELANRSKSRFLASMSHEIRTPLNSIIGITELLSNTVLNEKQEKYISSLATCSNMLLDQVNNILDLSKIEANEITLRNDAIELKTIVSDIAQILEPKAKEKNVVLTYNFLNNVSKFVSVDSARLHQILLNLTNNALKFTQNGEVTINVTCVVKGKTKTRLRFEVQDTGIGISQDKQEYIFDEFRQIDNTETRSHLGTGLGLSICKKLVGLMGGNIGVISEPGKGSTFWFELTLPICSEDEIKESKQKLSKPVYTANNVVHFPATLQSGAPTTNAGANILVVDDIHSNLDVMQEMLEKLGCNVYSANNGKAAIAMLEANKDKYNLVLMDCQMPNMDGYEATGIIRNKSWGRNLPIIATTAHALNSDRAKCIAAGMNDYISKPIHLGEIKRVLSKYVSKAS